MIIKFLLWQLLSVCFILAGVFVVWLGVWFVTFDLWTFNFFEWAPGGRASFAILVAWCEGAALLAIYS